MRRRAGRPARRCGRPAARSSRHRRPRETAGRDWIARPGPAARSAAAPIRIRPGSTGAAGCIRRGRGDENWMTGARMQPRRMLRPSRARPWPAPDRHGVWWSAPRFIPPRMQPYPAIRTWRIDPDQPRAILTVLAHPQWPATPDDADTFWQHALIEP